MGIIIALSGFARSGKDTAADVLVEEFGFRKVAFADKLREVLYQLNPLVAYTGTPPNKNWLVQDVIDQYGWDGYKGTDFGPEIRRLLQRLGTEAGRQTLWDTIWIDAAFAGRSPDENIVISDARFFNEFDAVRDRGGVVWRIERTGVGPANDHASEIEAISYPHFNRRLINAGTVEDFKQTVREEFSLLRDDEPEAEHGTPRPPKTNAVTLKDMKDAGYDQDGLRSTPLPVKGGPDASGITVSSGYHGMPKRTGKIGGGGI